MKSGVPYQGSGRALQQSELLVLTRCSIDDIKLRHELNMTRMAYAQWCTHVTHPSRHCAAPSPLCYYAYMYSSTRPTVAATTARFTMT